MTITELRRRFKRWGRFRRHRIARSRWGPFRDAVQTSLVLLLVLWLVLGVRGVLSIAWMIPMFLGVSLLVVAFRRIGKERRCARCGYEQRGAFHAQCCPECGANWYRYGGTVKGQRMAHPALIAAGLLLAASLIVWVFLSFQMPAVGQAHYRLYPTSTLLRSAARDAGLASRHWEELQRRQLSPQQELELAEALLDRRARRGHLSPGQARSWLDGAVLGDRLTQELVDRYFAESIVVRIDSPDEVTLGEELTVRIYIDFRGVTGPVVIPGILFEGYFVGDDPRLHYRGEVIYPGYGFGGLIQRFRRVEERDPGPGNPQMTITPTESGPLDIRARYWIVGVPARPAHEITWNEDGTPQLPDGTFWAQQFELEQTIMVNP